MFLRAGGAGMFVSTISYRATGIGGIKGKAKAFWDGRAGRELGPGGKLGRRGWVGGKGGVGLEEAVYIQVVPGIVPIALHYLPVLPELNVEVVPVCLPFHKVKNPFLVGKQAGNFGRMGRSVDSSKLRERLTPLRFREVTFFVVFNEGGGVRTIKLENEFGGRIRE